MGIIRKAELNVNMNESILRLQGASSDTDCKLIWTFFLMKLEFKFFSFFHFSD